MDTAITVKLGKGTARPGGATRQIGITIQGVERWTSVTEATAQRWASDPTAADLVSFCDGVLFNTAANAFPGVTPGVEHSDVSGLLAHIKAAG